MNKPIKPTKKIEQPGSITFYFEHASNSVSLEYFNQWVKDNLPKGAFDVALTLDEEYDYYSGEIMSVYLQVEYKTLVDNTRYVSEMKKYKKKLAEWKKEVEQIKAYVNGKR